MAIVIPTGDGPHDIGVLRRDEVVWFDVDWSNFITDGVDTLEASEVRLPDGSTLVLGDGAAVPHQNLWTGPAPNAPLIVPTDKLRFFVWAANGAACEPQVLSVSARISSASGTRVESRTLRLDIIDPLADAAA